MGPSPTQAKLPRTLRTIATEHHAAGRYGSAERHVDGCELEQRRSVAPPLGVVDESWVGAVMRAVGSEGGSSMTRLWSMPCPPSRPSPVPSAGVDVEIVVVAGPMRQCDGLGPAPSCFDAADAR